MYATFMAGGYQSYLIADNGTLTQGTTLDVAPSFNYDKILEHEGLLFANGYHSKIIDVATVSGSKVVSQTQGSSNDKYLESEIVSMKEYKGVFYCLDRSGIISAFKVDDEEFAWVQFPEQVTIHGPGGTGTVSYTHLTLQTTPYV